MGKIKDINGRRFGKLIIIKPTLKRISGNVVWLCRCDCGKEKLIQQNSLSTGYTKSCGCISSLNLEGKIFGKWKVIKKSLKQDRHGIRWDCKCECGIVRSVIGTSLQNHKTLSCGCVKKIKGKDNKCWKGYEEISGEYWTSLQKGSELRKHKFKINKKYAWDLFLKQNRKCALSGLEINFYKNKQTASLDRIDSKLGYIEGNVQWVHKDLNRMKRDYPNEYFIEMCSLIGNHNSK